MGNACSALNDDRRSGGKKKKRPQNNRKKPKNNSGNAAEVVAVRVVAPTEESALDTASPAGVRRHNSLPPAATIEMSKFSSTPQRDTTTTVSACKDGKQARVASVHNNVSGPKSTHLNGDHPLSAGLPAGGDAFPSASCSLRGSDNQSMIAQVLPEYQTNETQAPPAILSCDSSKMPKKQKGPKKMATKSSSREDVGPAGSGTTFRSIFEQQRNLSLGNEPPATTVSSPKAPRNPLLAAANDTRSIDGDMQRCEDVDGVVKNNNNSAHIKPSPTLFLPSMLPTSTSGADFGAPPRQSAPPLSSSRHPRAPPTAHDFVRSSSDQIGNRRESNGYCPTFAGSSGTLSSSAFSRDSFGTRHGSASPPMTLELPHLDSISSTGGKPAHVRIPKKWKHQ